MTRFIVRGELDGLPIEEEFDLASDALMFAEVAYYLVHAMAGGGDFA